MDDLLDRSKARLSSSSSSHSVKRSEESENFGIRIIGLNGTPEVLTPKHLEQHMAQDHGLNVLGLNDTPKEAVSVT